MDAVHFVVDGVYLEGVAVNGETIVDGNRRFRRTAAHLGLAMMPRRRMLVVGCADPRVDPQQVLGLQLGDVAVIRNIGGRVTAPTLATLAGLGRLGARPARVSTPPTAPRLDLVVLHHTDCGIVLLGEEPEALAGFLGTDVAHVAAMHVDDPHAAVVHDVTVLRGLGMPGARIWGLVYDVATGAVEIAAAPEDVAA